MSMMVRKSFVMQSIIAVLVGFGLVGCKPAGQPVDLLKTQKDALDKARGVDKQLQQGQDRRKAAEEAQN